MDDDIYLSYKILELEPGAPIEQVKQAWRDQVKVWHPDRFPNDAKLQRKALERLKEINRAYDVLEKYFSTWRHGSASNSSAHAHTYKQTDASRQEQASAPEAPPRTTATQAAPASNTTSSNSNIAGIWAIVGGSILTLLLVIELFTSEPQIGNPGAAVKHSPLPSLPVSKALDEKNGFKDFRFGMSPDEVRAILTPSKVTDNPRDDVIVFHYVETLANQIGDFQVDSIALNFFKRRLYRIDLQLSSFQNEIFEAFKVNFGEPHDAAGWKRGEQLLSGKAWRGEKVSAAFLGPQNQAWDVVVIYDQNTSEKAQKYALSEPERAAADFGTVGFRSLRMGMKLQELTVPYIILKDDKVTDVKKVTFRGDDLKSIGFYPLKGLSAEFFQDQLYRIDLIFDENRNEVFESFKYRFSDLRENNTWTRGSSKLKALEATSGDLMGIILAPESKFSASPAWDAVVLLHLPLWRAAVQFNKDAPKRAAEDL